MRFGAETRRMHVGARAGQQHAIHRVEQRIDIRDLRRSGKHHRQRPGAGRHRAKVSFADQLGRKPALHQVCVADHTDHGPLHILAFEIRSRTSEITQKNRLSGHASPGREVFPSDWNSATTGSRLNANGSRSISRTCFAQSRPNFTNRPLRWTNSSVVSRYGPSANLATASRICFRPALSCDPVIRSMLRWGIATTRSPLTLIWPLVQMWSSNSKLAS